MNTIEFLLLLIFLVLLLAYLIARRLLKMRDALNNFLKE
jgi:hypothetical protein